jgi:hypothetical protein
VTAISIDKEPIFVSGGGFARRVAKPGRELGTKMKFHENQASCWRLIFLQSVANGCAYRGEDLPHSKWQWPKGTWFQQQRCQLKAIELSGATSEELKRREKLARYR